MTANHVLVEHLGDIEVTAKLLRSVTNLNPHASSLSIVPVGRYSPNTVVNDRGKVVQLISGARTERKRSMKKQKVVGKKPTSSGETDVLGKYIRQLELDLGGLGYEVERERPFEVTEFLSRVAPVDAAYDKRFADRVRRPVWLMVTVEVTPKDDNFDRYKSLIERRNRANCTALGIEKLKNGNIKCTVAWGNGRAGTQNDARQWAGEIFGYRTKEEKDRYIKIETTLIFKTLGMGNLDHRHLNCGPEAFRESGSQH